MTKINAAITAVSHHVPDYVLSNKELEKLVDTTDEWITTRTGIKERRILKGEDQGVTEIAKVAVEKLLQKRGIGPEEIDLVIFCTVTPDKIFPASANIVSRKVGMNKAFGYDLNAACSGFIYGLVTGSKFIETGSYKKVLVIGADKMSSIVDYSDQSTCIIFGDGAGAVLLEPTTEGMGLQDSILRSDGSGEAFLHQKAGGSERPASEGTLARKEHYVHQEGKTVFKFAVSKMAEVSYEILERNALTADDVAWLVPHQANLRIIDATSNRMGLNKDKVMINIDRYGNTTNGTIPICLSEWENKLHKGDNIILSAFGGGFTWGAVYLKWAYDPS
ncbi:MAG: ketoacyl-ACP synthase III [Flavobacteriales bacterium]|nr:ketoacyl-ACP synthase III [Flavobacteriales bacterium]